MKVATLLLIALMALTLALTMATNNEFAESDMEESEAEDVALAFADVSGSAMLGATTTTDSTTQAATSISSRRRTVGI